MIFESRPTKKLVRGVIYDDPSAVKERAIETAECLSGLVGCIGDTYESKSVPTRDEYIASAALYGLINPVTGDRNMIIPSSLVDDRLCSELEKIDIGETLVCDFVKATYERHEDEEAFLNKVGETANKYSPVIPEDFCYGEEECLLKHVDKQDKNLGRFFIDGKEVSREEMASFLEKEPELASLLPFVKGGKVSCF